MLRALSLLLLGTTLGAGWLWFDFTATLQRPVGDTPWHVERGQTWDGLVERIARAEQLSPRQVLYLRLYGRLSGKADRIRAGEYRPEAGENIAGLIERLIRGEVVLHSLTLIEGWRFDQALAAIQAHPAIERTLSPDPQAVMAALGHADLHPEGRFLPETYRFARGETDLAFLRRAYAAMEAALARAWMARKEGLPLNSPDELLILASIVERETALPEERAQIAGVFVRRLRLGMRLQTDPTVIYGLGERFDGNIRRRDLRTDTPYNTYTRRGLPPTPICLPGVDALHAAAQPADGDALYFVSRGDGSHVFSATLEEHNRAVRKYQLGRGS